MAITRPVRPSLIVAGIAVAVTPRRKYDDAKKAYTDEIVGYEVLVSQESGAQLSVRFRDDDPLPAVLHPVAVLVDVNESREYGASLMFQRVVVPDDLDKINSSLSVSASKG